MYESKELPVWRRSGFWTTSFEGLDLDALQVRHHAPGTPLPEVVRDTLPERPRAGRIVQRDGSVVHVELDPELAAARRDALLAGGGGARAHGAVHTVVLEAPDV